ncbi:MAG: phosphatase PAP2 family protein [Calditrichaceae bacterium]|jgi:undecaprenyl-diphosphatase
MLDYLNHIDTVIFIFFNVKLANPVFDVIMPVITYRETWYPLWVIAIVGLLWKGGKKGRWVVLIAILAVGSADLMVDRIMKPAFHRIRPCNVVEEVHMLVGKKSSKSMPSAHAANFFALATVFSYFYRRYQWIFWFLASLVAYSRIAVGVHYPFDALVGAITGACLALFWILMLTKVIKINGHVIVKLPDP